MGGATTTPSPRRLCARKQRKAAQATATSCYPIDISMAPFDPIAARRGGAALAAARRTTNFYAPDSVDRGRYLLAARRNRYRYRTGTRLRSYRRGPGRGPMAAPRTIRTVKTGGIDVSRVARSFIKTCHEKHGRRDCDPHHSCRANSKSTALYNNGRRSDTLL